MPTYNCQYGNCSNHETAEKMITVTGAGVRLKYCSWIHAAGGCLHHLYARNVNTYWSQLVQRVEKLLDEAQKHYNCHNPTENIMPKEKLTEEEEHGG